MKKLELDWHAINNMSVEQKRKILPRLTKVANERIRQLEKRYYEFIPSLKKARRIIGKDKFKSSFKKASKHEIDIQLRAVEYFLKSEMSTLKGANKYVKDASQRISYDRKSRLGYFMRGIEIPDYLKAEFFNFMQAEEYKEASKRYNSEDLMELFIDLRDEKKYSYEEIKKGFKEFLNKVLSDDEIFEKFEKEFRDGRIWD